MSDREAVGGAMGAAGSEPRAVSAGRGWQWIVGGFNDHFSKAQGAWIGVTLLLLVITVVGSMIPLVNLLVGVLGTIFAGGLMLGCHAQRSGEPFRVGHLFAAFSGYGGKLAVVGLIYIVATAAIAMLPMLLMGASMAGGMGAGMGGGMGAGGHGSGMHANMMLAMLLVLALLVPVVMAYWFAPAIVVLEDEGPIEAMKRSFTGCLRNVVPFLVYGAAMAVIMIVAIIPLGLGLLVAVPTMVASVYVAWRDIFERPVAEEDASVSGP